jgi:hypothetical protein
MIHANDHLITLNESCPIFSLTESQSGIVTIVLEVLGSNTVLETGYCLRSFLTFLSSSRQLQEYTLN